MEPHELLAFARGPALKASLIVFAVAATWRLVAIFLLPGSKDLTSGRPGVSEVGGAVRKMFQVLPHKPFRDRGLFVNLNAWVFHFGLLFIVLLGTPHILFLGDFLGFTWPGLPKGVIDVISVVTLASLIAILVYRVQYKVTRLLSGFDDYFSWLVTFLPVLTGLLATFKIGARYETLLALHILSFELLLIWFPFSKLMHAFSVFFSRARTGARYAHRGVEI